MKRKSSENSGSVDAKQPKSSPEVIPCCVMYDCYIKVMSLVRTVLNKD